MRMYLRDTDNEGAIQALSAKVEHWELVASGAGWQEEPFEEWLCDLFVARSKDWEIWALYSLEAEYDDSVNCGAKSETPYTGRVVAVLTDPNTTDECEIVRLLMDAYTDAGGRGVTSVFELGRFELRHNVKICTVSELFPDAPEGWLQWDATVEVAFNLVEHTCVSSSLFDEWRHDTFLDAARTVFSTDHVQLFPVYSLVVARGVAPHLGWQVTWPLVRRGKSAPVQRAFTQQGPAPWVESVNTTIAVLEQSPKGANAWGPGYGWQGSVVRLTVGGRTPQDAVDNWYKFAIPLRKLRRELNP